MKFGFSCLIIICFSMSLAFSEDIAGFWKHAEHPVWIEMSLKDASGTVVRNDKFPERVGRKIVKDIKSDTSEKNLWRAQVYIEKLEKYTEADISLHDNNRMRLKGQVGFFSRSTEWLRVDALPESKEAQR